jgi:YD repeat-containing protein
MSAVSLPYAPGQSIVWTTYTYDGTGRTISVRQGDGSTSSYSYAANNTTQTDPTGKWKTFTTDAFGNLAVVTEPDPTNQPSGTIATYYTYNNANQLTQVSMPRAQYNQVRTFTWSGTDLASTTNPENGTVSYQYDGAHHVTLRTDAKGQQTQYSYDSYGRLIQTRHYTSSNPSSQTDQIDYQYDTNSIEPSYSSNSWGRLTAVSWGPPGYSWTMTDYNHVTMWYEYNYNTAGRVTNQRMAFGLYTGPGDSNAFVTKQNMDAAYAWDNRGRMTSLTGPDGNTYQYQYDSMSNLSTMNSWNPFCACWSPLATASYNWAGLMTSGPSGTRTYNGLLQLTRIQNGNFDEEYIYQAGQNNGRIVQSIDHVRGETVNYSNDC